MFFHLGNRLRIDHRALADAGLEAAADLDLGRARRQLFDELIVDRFMHVKAVGAHASLAGIAVFRLHRAFHCCVEIGVVEHDKRGVTTQLQRELFHRGRALLHQDATDRGRSGKGKMAHRRAGT